VLALLASLLVLVSPAHAAVGLHVSGTRILEANGNDFVMRGVNHPHVWFEHRTNSFADIKSFGANTVRVVLGSGQRWGPSTDVANVVALCRQNRLICVLEAHDTTGFGEEGAAASLDQAATYWISQADALRGQESYVVINIGNEPFGNNQQVSATWATATSNAISRLRDAGLDHLIMVDGPMWGQDWQNIMRDNAAAVFTSDPDRNTVFSIHMYSVYSTPESIISYLDAFRAANLPLVIGEFGHTFPGGADPDEDTMMAQAQERGLGYLGWSWSGNTDGALDMTVDFDPTNLTAWGERFLNGVNGIRQTSREATIYGGGGDDTQPPTTPGTPTTSDVTSDSVTLNWTASTDNVGVTGYEVYRAPGASGDTFTLVGNPTGTTFTNTGLTAATTYRYRVRARDAQPNFSANSGTVVVTTQTSGGTGTCQVSYSASDWGGSSGFTASVAITNTGTTTVNGWTLAFAFPSGQRITPPGWGAVWAQASGGANVTATNLDWNRSLAPGGSTQIGFNGTFAGTNAAPTSFTLNGNDCTERPG
jgi:mannan endo-1,4-beta-mannosidase